MSEDAGSEEEPCPLPALKAGIALAESMCSAAHCHVYTRMLTPVLQFARTAAEGRPYPLCACFEDGA